jgi:hypothetical protein
VLFNEASVAGAMTSTPGDFIGPAPDDSKAIREPSGDTTVLVIPTT